MSRKTTQIKKSLENLEMLRNQLAVNLEELPENQLKKARTILEEMETETKNISLWFDMLYKYNGTSRTNSKVQASRENGKKGGRPPKKITDLKRKCKELEEKINQLHAEKLATFDPEKEVQLTTQEEGYKLELTEAQDNLEKALLTVS